MGVQPGKRCMTRLVTGTERERSGCADSVGSAGLGQVPPCIVGLLRAARVGPGCTRLRRASPGCPGNSRFRHAASGCIRQPVGPGYARLRRLRVPPGSIGLRHAAACSARPLPGCASYPSGNVSLQNSDISCAYMLNPGMFTPNSSLACTYFPMNGQERGHFLATVENSDINCFYFSQMD